MLSQMYNRSVEAISRILRSRFIPSVEKQAKRAIIVFVYRLALRSHIIKKKNHELDELFSDDMRLRFGQFFFEDENQRTKEIFSRVQKAEAQMMICDLEDLLEETGKEGNSEEAREIEKTIEALKQMFEPKDNRPTIQHIQMQYSMAEVKRLLSLCEVPSDSPALLNLSRLDLEIVKHLKKKLPSMIASVDSAFIDDSIPSRNFFIIADPADLISLKSPKQIAAAAIAKSKSLSESAEQEADDKYSLKLLELLKPTIQKLNRGGENGISSTGHEGTLSGSVTPTGAFSNPPYAEREIKNKRSGQVHAAKKFSELISRSHQQRSQKAADGGVAQSSSPRTPSQFPQRRAPFLRKPEGKGSQKMKKSGSRVTFSQQQKL